VKQAEGAALNCDLALLGTFDARKHEPRSAAPEALRGVLGDAALMSRSTSLATGMLPSERSDGEHVRTDTVSGRCPESGHGSAPLAERLELASGATTRVVKSLSRIARVPASAGAKGMLFEQLARSAR
jgi:hypothetical protein